MACVIAPADTERAVLTGGVSDGEPRIEPRARSFPRSASGPAGGEGSCPRVGGERARGRRACEAWVSGHRQRREGYNHSRQHAAGRERPDARGFERLTKFPPFDGSLFADDRRHWLKVFAPVFRRGPSFPMRRTSGRSASGPSPRPATIGSGWRAACRPWSASRSSLTLPGRLPRPTLMLPAGRGSGRCARRPAKAPDRTLRGGRPTFSGPGQPLRRPRAPGPGARRHRTPQGRGQRVLGRGGAGYGSAFDDLRRALRG